MQFTSELRYAARRLLARPAFALTAVLTLSFGIGLTTALFSVVDAVLLKPLPWRDADALVTIWVVRPHWRNDPALAASAERGALSWPMFKDLQRNSRVFDEVATFSAQRQILNAESNELVHVLRVSAGFLPMLGVSPQLGRFFTGAEDDPDTDAIVVSHEASQTRFGGDVTALGRHVSIADKPYVVVGVLPPRFTFDGVVYPEFVLPWGSAPASDRTPGNHFMNGLARLKPGVSLADATRDTDSNIRASSATERKEARLSNLDNEQRGQLRRPLWILLSGAALLLLIACANVAGLLLSDTTARRTEIAVRAALGGSRRQLTRQFLAESLVLTAAALCLGTLFAAAFAPLLVASAPTQLPRLGDVTIDARVLGFSSLTMIVATLLFGMLPAMVAASIDPILGLRDGARTLGAGRSHIQRGIVAAQVTLAIVLLAAASLLSETWLRMTSQPVGFDAENVLVTAVRLPPAPGALPEQRMARIDTLVERLSTLPGVVSAAGVSSAPFSGGYGSNSIQVEGKTFDVDPSASRQVVTERYFDVMGMPIVRGRGFAPSDAAGSHVAVVTDEFERRLMDGDALGKRFILNKQAHTVIGVVRSPKHREYTDVAAPGFYALYRQLQSFGINSFVVRTRVAAESLASTVRQSVLAVEPAATVVTIDTMQDLMRRSVAEERYRAFLSVVFAAAALLLSALGLFGLLMRSVAVRRREIGVRLAVGATPRRVSTMVMREGLALVLAGLGCGIPLALGASIFVESLLFGVTATSPHIFVFAAVCLSATAVVATLVPAARAAKIDPMVALRDL